MASFASQVCYFVVPLLDGFGAELFPAAFFGAGTPGRR